MGIFDRLVRQEGKPKAVPEVKVEVREGPEIAFERVEEKEVLLSSAQINSLQQESVFEIAFHGFINALEVLITNKATIETNTGEYINVNPEDFRTALLKYGLKKDKLLNDLTNQFKNMEALYLSKSEKDKQIRELKAQIYTINQFLEKLIRLYRTIGLIATDQRSKNKRNTNIQWIKGKAKRVITVRKKAYLALKELIGEDNYHG